LICVKSAKLFQGDVPAEPEVEDQGAALRNRSSERRSPSGPGQPRPEQFQLKRDRKAILKLTKLLAFFSLEHIGDSR
jgi:hypothetical protein